MWCFLPENESKRIIIVGAGFSGLELANNLKGSQFQVVLIDEFNYHQFQPLLYQVATSGLEPSAISFPLRKIFQNADNVIVRITRVTRIDVLNQIIETTIGDIRYDYLVLATGTKTNFFGKSRLQDHALTMKSVNEALSLRNSILQNFENALNTTDPEILSKLLNIVVVGGGPTGVEISGTLAEMKRFILPKDYPELDFNRMKIYLIEAGNKLLSGMSPGASEKAKEYLEKMGIIVKLNTIVDDYDGENIITNGSSAIRSATMVWAAGIKGNLIDGLPESVLSHGNRIKVDRINRVLGLESIFALGDLALMQEPRYPEGHPQLAQPAIQQARLLAGNLKRLASNKPIKEFSYYNKGIMATIGRNRAVVDLPFFSFSGFLAWLTWMFIHLMAIVGVKNRLLILINWFWNYITYDQSLRLIINPSKKK